MIKKRPSSKIYEILFRILSVSVLTLSPAWAIASDCGKDVEALSAVYGKVDFPNSKSLYELRGRYVRVIVKDDLFGEPSETITGVVRGAPYERFDSRHDSSGFAPLIMEDGKTVAHSKILSIEVVVQKDQIRAPLDPNPNGWKQLDPSKFTHAGLVGRTVELQVYDYLINMTLAYVGEVTAVPVVTHDALGEENSPTPYKLKGVDRVIRKDSVTAIYVKP